MSDEEKEAMEDFKREYKDGVYLKSDIIIELDTAKIINNLIEKQQKEIEELKEERKSYTEKYIHDNPWLYKQLNEVYMLRTEAEQKERKAYIKGTNDADKLCNKKWEDKIKSKIEEAKKNYNDLHTKHLRDCGIAEQRELAKIEFGQSLLEKE